MPTYDNWNRLSAVAMIVFVLTLIPAVMTSPWFFVPAIPAGAVFLYCGHRMDKEA